MFFFFFAGLKNAERLPLNLIRLISRLIGELSFPPYQRGRGIQQSVILADFALIVQPITLLYTIFDWRGALCGTESSQRRSPRNVYQSRVAQKYKLTIFVAIFSNKII